MDLFIKGKLNSLVFDLDVRRGTHDLVDVLNAAKQANSSSVESTHFLMALAKVPGGITQKSLARLGVTLDQWEGGLANCANKTQDVLPLGHLMENSLHESALVMLRAAEACCVQYQFERISEPVLLLGALQHVTPAVRDLCEIANIDLQGWCDKIESLIKPFQAVPAFDEAQRERGALLSAEEEKKLTGEETVRMESFSPTAKKVFRLLQSETESLGYLVADPRHLLLALLSHEGGATQYGLYHQGRTPRKIQEAVMLSLRNKAKQTRSVISLRRKHLQPILQEILHLSGEVAGRERLKEIAGAHLLRAFLSTESMALRILEDEKVDIASLRDIAERYDLTQEEEERDTAVADIQTVQDRLQRRLVGQEQAIERILPYVQRMRFGFTTPGRPVGVFLFCGQSGSGKTEMAKELARAVYGSEENLIFLEMGQFNSRESMNVFVGAPPGYVGYGEGKLTNGLRDKPRAVVLFDEVEKADTRVLDALLRFLDEGKIDDPAGPVRDGSQCILILTSNVGAEKLSQLWDQLENDSNWRAVVREKLREEFKAKNFRVEFLNRVDELILFRTLKEMDYAKIAERLLQRDLARLNKERQIEVILDYPVGPPIQTAESEERISVVAQMIGVCCEQIGEGARAAQRLTQSVVITPVIDFVVRNAPPPPVRLKVEATRTTNDPGCEPMGVVQSA